MDLPQRKPNRLKDYDYSTPGIYFITICTKNMTELFWDHVFIPDFQDGHTYAAALSVGEITDLPKPSSNPQNTNPPQLTANPQMISNPSSSVGEITDLPKPSTNPKKTNPPQAPSRPLAINDRPYRLSSGSMNADVLQNYHLSVYGKIVDAAIRNIPKIYPMVTVDKYVVMPNHVHLLLQIHTEDHSCASRSSAISPTSGRPTVMTIVKHLKGFVTKAIGFSVWQRSFHDHILRRESEYPKIWQYIDQNPLKWTDDCFHPANLPHQ